MGSFDFEFSQIYIDKHSILEFLHNPSCPCGIDTIQYIYNGPYKMPYKLNIKCHGTIMINKWSAMTGSANIRCNTLVNWGYSLSTYFYYNPRITIDCDDIYGRM